MKLKLANARIIDPANQLDSKGDVYIADGKIFGLLEVPADFSPEQEIDLEGRILCPGLVDLSARMGEPGHEYKATVASESRAAASSGITSVCHPPDTLPVIDTPAVAELIQQRAQSANRLRIFPLAALTHGLGGERLSEMLALKKAGCVGVSNASIPHDNTDVLRNALAYARSCDMTVFLQAQNRHLGGNGVAHDGAISTRLGLPPVPESAETTAVAQALLLIEQIGCRTHFLHLSAARSVSLVTEAKAAGLPVTADASICHLHLTEMDVDAFNADCHLRPPLRSQRDRDALCRALADGHIDAVCSAHHPHDDDAKAAPFAETQAGASCIELLLPLVLHLVDKKVLPLADAIASVTCKPARILGIDAGNLSPGASADIAVIDLQRHFTVDKNRLLSAGRNCPFKGWELNGAVSHTFFKGQLVYEAGSSQ